MHYFVVEARGFGALGLILLVCEFSFLSFYKALYDNGRPWSLLSLAKSWTTKVDRGVESAELVKRRHVLFEVVGNNIPCTPVYDSKRIFLRYYF